MRNLRGLSEHEIKRCLLIWEFIRGSEWCDLDTAEAAGHGSRTRFNEDRRIVHLGADVEPGDGVDARSRMSSLTCLLHELAHAKRYHQGYTRPVVLPDKLIDEAEASLEASFFAALSSVDRADLVEDARDRLTQWLKEARTEREVP